MSKPLRILIVEDTEKDTQPGPVWVRRSQTGHPRFGSATEREHKRGRAGYPVHRPVGFRLPVPTKNWAACQTYRQAAFRVHSSHAPSLHSECAARSRRMRVFVIYW